MRPRSWVVAFLAAGILVLGILESRLDLLASLTRQECQTNLCCEDCRSIRVSRVIEGDTFDSSDGRVRLFGGDTPDMYTPGMEKALKNG